MKVLSKILLVLAFGLIGINTVSAQNSRQEKKAAKLAAIENMVEKPDFVFKANYVIPMTGASRTLTSDYDLVVSKDTIIAALPYFGRAYMAPMGAAIDGGINFTSTKFTYASKVGKKGNWTITITPKDNNGTDWRDVRYMVLSISTDGIASLSVNSNNRDQISFNGDIEPRKK